VLLLSGRSSSSDTLRFFELLGMIPLDDEISHKMVLFAKTDAVNSQWYARAS
jgi:hypothetical protein